MVATVPYLIAGAAVMVLVIGWAVFFYKPDP